jgi:hypothetical protein
MMALAASSPDIAHVREPSGDTVNVQLPSEKIAKSATIA